MIGSEAKGRAYASQMPVQGERRFIKRDRQSRARGSREDVATEEPAAGRTATYSVTRPPPI
jgi:hypothetical protein